MRVYLLVAALLIGGCAIDRVRIERAGEVVEQGGPLIAASSDLLNTIAATSREASIELALADPLCDWPEINIATGTPATSLCDPASSSHVTFTRIETTSFAPTVQLIAALSGYVAAVDAVVTDSASDQRMNLAKAKATIEGIIGGISSATGAHNPVAGLGANQQAALNGIVAMIDTLARESDQARQLHAVEANSPKLREVTAALRRDLENWSNLALISELDTLQTVQTMRWQRDRMLRLKPSRTSDERRSLLDDNSRRALLNRRLETEGRLVAARQLPKTLSQAVSDFEAAHDSYVNALEDKALTPENRRRVAQVTRERLRESLALLAQTIAAFK